MKAMINEVKFKSQICTSVEQSKRLLDLGLKPETADMVLIKELAYDAVAHCTYDADTYMIRPIDYLVGEGHRGHIHAWSLHRLIEMICNKECEEHYYFDFSMDYDSMADVYDSIIEVIERHIKDNFINKEYLKQ